MRLGRIAKPAKRSRADSLRLFTVHGAVVVGLYVLSFPTTHERIPAVLRPIVGCMMSATVTGNIQGYYDQLLDKPQDVSSAYDYERQDRIHKVLRPVSDLRQREMIPDLNFVRHGIRFTSNAWGMHDRNITEAKPIGTVRIAVLGSSHVMGWGVTQDQLMTRRLEQLLNENEAIGSSVEVLNFGVSGYSPLSQLGLLNTKLSRFEPDIVLFVSHSVDQEWTVMHMQRVRAENTTTPFAFIEDILRDNNITTKSNEVLARSRLLPRAVEITTWVYRMMVEESHRMDALPVAAFAPLPREGEILRRLASNRAVKDSLQIKELQASGFLVMDLRNVFQGRSSNELALRQWEGHYSHVAHELMADALYSQIISSTEICAVLHSNGTAQPHN